MARELRRQIRHLDRCIQLLHYVDLRTYKAGRALFASDAGLALWLCAPEPSLKGMVPLLCCEPPKAGGRSATSSQHWHTAFLCDDRDSFIR